MKAIYSISPLSKNNAREISTWSYDPPFDLYDLSPKDISVFLKPDYYYHQILDQKGDLIGYCCFGLDARVPGGDYLINELEVLDVGVGMRPVLTGAGRGHDFVSAILEYASDRFDPDRFRVTVAAFNERSLRTFRKLGFNIQGSFIRELVDIQFYQLEKSVKEEDYG